GPVESHPIGGVPVNAAIQQAKARLRQVETQSRFSLLFAHDLRANALLRLSRWKTGAHFSGSCATACRAPPPSSDLSRWSRAVAAPSAAAPTALPSPAPPRREDRSGA